MPPADVPYLDADPGRVATPAFLESCAMLGFRVAEKRTIAWASGEIAQKIDVYTIGRT